MLVESEWSLALFQRSGFGFAAPGKANEEKSKPQVIVKRRSEKKSTEGNGAWRLDDG